MATMVKEKRREKKRSKEKYYNKTVTEPQSLTDPQKSFCEKKLSPPEVAAESILTTSENTHQLITEINLDQFETDTPEQTVTQSSIELPEVEPISLESNISYGSVAVDSLHSELNNDYVQCITSIEHVNLSDAEVSLASEANESHYDNVTIQAQGTLENNAPSAPMLEEDLQHVPFSIQVSEVKETEVISLKSMPLEEAIRLFGGAEIAGVMAMSEREEAIVESGPKSGPEHPLVDLLSTFRRSLIAVESERIKLTNCVAEEKKFRSALWIISERHINEVTKCACGRSVTFRAKYEHADFQTSKLPIARLKLKGILKDVQECYCHHQHEALLAHYQIEDFVSEIIKSHKGDIREALTLVLLALKQCDDAPPVLAGALERWARALSSALLDQRDIRQLLFLIHHLFRQTRSVRWAASIISVSVNDSVGAARAVALLELLFARTKLEAAVECVEDKEEAWEEVYKDGGGGAVSDDSLREQDLMALLRALPVRELVSRLLLMHADVIQAREYHWGDESGRGVLRACCGVRALLRALALAAAAHARYARLLRALRGIAKDAILALAALHEHASPGYTKDIELKVLGELQAVFVSGLELLDADTHELPASLLAGHAARDYCAGHAACVRDHAERVVTVRALGLARPRRACGVHVRVVAHAAVQRRADHELACFVLDFLFQTGVKRNDASTACKGACKQTARECLPAVLEAFPYLYPMALHFIADTYQDEKLDPSCMEWLSVSSWRPNSGELRAVLDDWARRCGALLPPLLLALHCGTHGGLCLESQLALGSWLCEYVRSRPGEPEEWCWKALCRLRVHRTCWGLVCDAPEPEPQPDDFFSKAYALVASSWGHCIPLICSKGVDTLCALAAARPHVALHCLASIMLVLAHSPESVATTPRFTEVLTTLVTAGPGLVQRALGRGGAPAAHGLLALLRLQLRPGGCGDVPRSALVSVWTAALWRASPALATLLDAALATPRCNQLDQHAGQLALAADEESHQYILQALKWYAQAPLICESAIRAWHSQREVRTRMFPRLLDALHAQRCASQRIHVDNALKSIGVTGSSEQLAIYRAAEAVTTSSPTHPAHALLWRLLMQLYLQPAPSDTRNDALPVGPLFFSGLIKSRTLAQLKRRLLENIKYHSIEADNLKTKQDKPNTQAVPEPPQRSKSKSQTPDDHLTSSLSIQDLTGDSSENSDPDCDLSEEESEVVEQEGASDVLGSVADLLAYHVGAKRMFQEYARWLDEGDRTKAQPHHAEIARYIPEQALEAAFIHESHRRQSTVSSDMEPLPLPARAPPPAPPPPTPFQRATRALLRIRGFSRRRTRIETIKSPVEYVNYKDARTVLSLVEKHLRDIEQLSQEWCKESGAVLKLDEQLWELVKKLRVPRTLCVLRSVCANRCEPLQLLPRGQEWCISTNAQQGIIENRRSARLALRRLARSRPHAARSAAALLALARRIGSAELARRIAECAWRSAGAVSEQCAPAAAALAALMELIAERWLWHDGETCARLIARWCARAGSPLQHAAAALLVAPARCPPPHAPPLHAALLAASLPPPVLFQALSKFELGKWSQVVDAKARRDMLDSLVAAAQRWGLTPDEEQQPLVELIGVQMAAVCSSSELCALTCACARACAGFALPAAILPHVMRAADRCAAGVPFDQLGHLLRELGLAWWEARAQPKLDLERVSSYAPHFAKLLNTLHGAFVAAAVALSYAHEKVGVVSWASLAEAWSPWVTPPAPPRLPPALLYGLDHAVMLQSFRHAARQLAATCPGVEEVLLSQVWEWVVQTQQVVCGCPSQEGRMQMSSLLVTLAELPWTSHQWLTAANLQALLQVSQCGDEEMLVWCARCCSELDVHSWLRGEEHSPAPRLAALLYLFTASPLVPLAQTLSTACQLPWTRLPEAALDAALEQFFQKHHGLAAPYHDLPQFKVILAASELTCPLVGVGVGPTSRAKRARCVSQWSRAAAAPALLAHVPAHASALANTLAAIAPHLEQSAGELAELLGRALVITCLEPAAAHAAPVWESFILSSEPAFVLASLQATAGLTAFEYFASLSEAAVAAHMRQGGAWSMALSLRRACVWPESAPLCARARLHAAYAAHAAHAAGHHAGTDELRAALLALLAADIDFKKNNAIVAAWICLAGRCALAGAESESGAGAGARAGAGAECVSAARGLLARWGEAPRGLLRLVIATNGPTPEHRLLCLYAQCAASPGNDGAVRAYESACAALLGSSPDVAAWGKAPHPKRLPRLALKLFPQAENYFKLELDLAPEDIS